MKRWIATAVAAVFLAAAASTPAFAGDRGWATAGKILTGILGVTILGNAIANAHPYPYRAYAPPPVEYYPPVDAWIPGHYEARVESRWIPGHWEFETFRPDYDDGYGGRYGRRHARRVWIGGHYADVEVSVWIPGHWEPRG